MILEAYSTFSMIVLLKPYDVKFLYCCMVRIAAVPVEIVTLGITKGSIEGILKAGRPFRNHYLIK